MSKPTGTVTFLFTDMEGSSRQWEVDASATGTLVASHDRLVRTLVEGPGGYVTETISARP